MKAAYKPKILQMAVNPTIPYPVVFGVNYAPRYQSGGGAERAGFYGCSVTLAAAIVEPVGYYPIAVAPGHDVIFARADVLAAGGFARLLVPELQRAEEACCQAAASGPLTELGEVSRTAPAAQLLATV